MRRKPSASHCVKKVSLLTNRPISLVFLTGQQVVKISSSKRAFGQVVHHQLVAFHPERGALAVDQHARQVQLVAVQAQRLRRHLRVAAQPHAVEHAGLGGVQVEGQVDGVDPVGRGGCSLRGGSPWVALGRHAAASSVSRKFELASSL